jgi:c-di-GMP-binding flagellar brake protein YcgR
MWAIVSSPDITARLSTSGQLLVRSGIEIGRILDAMLEDRDTLTAALPSEMMFLTHLLYVEPVKGYMLLSYGQHKPANAAVLTVPKLSLRCHHRGAQFAFVAANPQAALRDGQPCLQCALPTVMLAMQQRPALPRTAVPAQAPVTCEVRMGPLTFEAKVTDVSLDGIGTLLSDPTIPLCAGTRLEHARIRHPWHEAIDVDLEVRHVTRVKLPNGETASRIGFKIVSSKKNLEELIRLFIIDLQEPA